MFERQTFQKASSAHYASQNVRRLPRSGWRRVRDQRIFDWICIFTIPKTFAYKSLFECLYANKLLPPLRGPPPSKMEATTCPSAAFYISLYSVRISFILSFLVDWHIGRRKISLHLPIRERAVFTGIGFTSANISSIKLYRESWIFWLSFMFPTKNSRQSVDISEGTILDTA